MPGTSSTSFVKHWPKPDRVLADLRKWAECQTAIRPELIALGYFGSHARGDTGFGSDLDLVAIIGESDVPQMQRRRYHLTPCGRARVASMPWCGTEPERRCRGGKPSAAADHAAAEAVLSRQRSRKAMAASANEATHT